MKIERPILPVSEMKIKSLKRNGLLFYFNNKEEFERLWKNIFKKGEYQIDLNNPKPFIFDVGAHIGLATIYFKSKYPKAKIIAFEPNPNTAKLLRLNIKANHLKNVKVIETAVWDKEGKKSLYIDSTSKIPWTWGDSLIENIWGSRKPPTSILVQAVKLSRFLTIPVDLLKIDVEGVEGKVIHESAKKLSLVKNIILEYHETPKTNPENQLEPILKILEKANFRFIFLEKDNVILIKGLHEF